MLVRAMPKKKTEEQKLGVNSMDEMKGESPLLSK